MSRDSLLKYPWFHLATALTLFLNLAVHSPQKARILVTMLTDVSDVGAPMNERVRGTLETGNVQGQFSFRSLDAAFVFILGIVVGGVQSILERQGQDDVHHLIKGLIVHALKGLGQSPDEAERVSAFAQKKVSQISNTEQ